MDAELSSYQQNQSSSFVEKLKKDPMVPAGVVLLTLLVGHGLYTFKKRKIDTSLFIVQYRVIAQGACLGCITLGMVYKMLHDHVWNKPEK